MTIKDSTNLSRPRNASLLLKYKEPDDDDMAGLETALLARIAGAAPAEPVGVLWSAETASRFLQARRRAPDVPFSPFAQRIEGLKGVEYGSGPREARQRAVASPRRTSMFLIAEDRPEPRGGPTEAVQSRRQALPAALEDEPAPAPPAKSPAESPAESPVPPPPPASSRHSPFLDPPLANPKARQARPLRPHPPLATPAARSSSVKISLTPAQNVTKRAGTRSINALENFEFGAIVGKGASASVYKGINLRTHQVVAIKQILLEPGQNVADLMGEIDLLKILKHPNIVKYHGFVKTAQLLNVFLEFCLGGSLRQLYKRVGHGLPEPQIIGYVKPILQGLQYLHEQGVVHRDVKAANVLVTNGGVKLADFGVATKVTSQYELVVGTPNWMAPETVLGGEGICTASDIWSLGATIIELLTTHPPYHELNPMATLHAIGTDDHPPLPKGISQLAQSFLLECFQKQPGLRKSAKLLLRHRWIGAQHPERPRGAERPDRPDHLNRPDRPDHPEVAERPLGSAVSLRAYADNDDSWESAFGLEFNEKISQLAPQAPAPAPAPALSKRELLTKYSDRDDEGDVDVEIGGLVAAPAAPDDEDPFGELECNSFDTNELHHRNRMEYLLQKFSKRVQLCHQGDDEVFGSLTKLAARMLHLIKKYPVSHDVLVGDHGILTLLELLEYAQEFALHRALWHHCLAILNHLFEANVAQFENFCLLGGIPVVTDLKAPAFGSDVRLQVVRFIECFHALDRALSMFVLCGGLRILAKFVEEDFDTSPRFAVVSIGMIHAVLSKDLTRLKLDLCRILSKYGVVFWLAVVLNRLTKPRAAAAPAADYPESIHRIVEILRYFGQSEAKVRINIANTDLFKLLIRVYDNLPSLEHQLTMLKFFKSMSCVLENLRPLYNTDILEFLVQLLARNSPAQASHYKEVVNVVCPLLYNCCYLNHSKEAQIVQLGVVPHLKALSKINLPFRQFVLPILCEFVYCDAVVRHHLVKHDILLVYFGLVADPYWQSNALDLVLHWWSTVRSDRDRAAFDTASHMHCLVAGFILPKVSSLELTLDTYLKFLHWDNFQRVLCTTAVLDNIEAKLAAFRANAVILLLLLRILKVLVQAQPQVHPQYVFGASWAATLARLDCGSVLVDELASEVLQLMAANRL